MIVSDKPLRVEPTSASGNDNAAAPARGEGNVGVPDVPGSPDGKTRVHVPWLKSRMSYSEAYQTGSHPSVGRITYYFSLIRATTVVPRRCVEGTKEHEYLVVEGGGKRVAICDDGGAKTRRDTWRNG
jgi:hypothetical protein